MNETKNNKNKAMISPLCSDDVDTTDGINSLRYSPIKPAHFESRSSPVPTLLSIITCLNIAKQAVSKLWQDIEDKTACRTCQQVRQQPLLEAQDKLNTAVRELQIYQSHHCCENLSSSNYQQTQLLEDYQQMKVRHDQVKVENEKLVSVIRELQEQREHLGAQLQAYKDDFESERSDRERAHGAIEELKIQSTQMEQSHRSQVKQLKMQIGQLQQQLQQLQRVAQPPQYSSHFDDHSDMMLAPPTTSRQDCRRIQPSNVRPSQGNRWDYDDLEIDGGRQEGGLVPRAVGPRTAPVAVCAASGSVAACSSGRYVRTAAAAESTSTVTSAAGNESRASGLKAKAIPPRSLYVTDSCDGEVKQADNSEAKSSAASTNNKVKLAAIYEPIYQSSEYYKDPVDEIDGYAKASKNQYKQDFLISEPLTEREHEKFSTCVQSSPSKISKVRHGKGQDADKLEEKFYEDMWGGEKCGIKHVDKVINLQAEENFTTLNGNLSSSQLSLDLLDTPTTNYLEEDYAFVASNSNHRSNHSISRNDSFNYDDIDGARNDVVMTQSSADVLFCPGCRKSFPIEHHHLLIDHMEDVCMK